MKRLCLVDNLRLFGDRLRPIKCRAFSLGAARAEADLLEGHTDSSFLAPDDAAWPLQVVGLHSEGEVVGDKERGDDFKRRACLRYVANSAVNRGAAELDRSGLQYTAALRGAGKRHSNRHTPDL
jgi:hypothetical protein